jgi:peptidyl-tRNA hydrolase, PTH1 family
MRFVVGIGNPGEEYARSRHNCGFMVVDELARRHGASAWRERWNADVAEWRQPSGEMGKVLLAKPRTYVNGSGEAVQALLAFHQAKLDELLVVVDDINLRLGDLRLRAEGSSGGHNGLRDVEARIGPRYPRLRVGVGRPADTGEQVRYVLAPFAASELDDVTAMVAKAADCVEAWVRDGVAVACRFNGPLRPPPAPVDRDSRDAPTA